MEGVEWEQDFVDGAAPEWPPHPFDGYTLEPLIPLFEDWNQSMVVPARPLQAPFQARSCESYLSSDI
jgi:hypothetical protein